LKGIVKTVFSTSSLSSSLSKLANLGRSTSPSNRPLTGLNSSRLSAGKNSSFVSNSQKTLQTSRLNQTE